MAAAFNSLGNHLVSDSAAAINAGDDLSTIDPSEGHRRRRGDDDEYLYDEDDMESLISQPVNGTNGKAASKPDEDVELPPHACA